MVGTYYLTGILCFFGLIFIQTVYGKFSCDGRISGYYADIESGCQVYHMCDGIGRQFSYTCPNATLFQQRMLVCDHWYMVNCSKAENDYNANSLIGQREKPFVDDNADNPYHRTPRPDLLSHPTENEYNIIYRNAKAQAGSSNLNIVGAPTDDENAEQNTDEPAYFLPSHWSTKFDDKYSTTTPKVTNVRQKSTVISNNYNTPTRTNFRKTTRNFNNGNSRRITTPVIRQTTTTTTTPPPPPPPSEIHVNFKSNFKATTPVYPKTVEKTEDDFIIQELPRIPPQQVNQMITTSAVQKTSTTLNTVPPISTSPEIQHVNFKSNFKATTPVYLKTVEKSEDDFIIQELPRIIPQLQGVNFQSDFAATTPVYPKAFELPKLEPDNDIGLLAPLPYKLTAAQEKTTTEEARTVNFESNFKATTPVYPKAFELPQIPPDNDIGLIPPQPFNEPLKVKSNQGLVNFASDFKATTPVYPTSVDATSPIPDEVGLLPPSGKQNQEVQVPSLSLSFLPPKLESKYSRLNVSEELNTKQPPSKFYQPPKFDPDYTEETEQNNNRPIVPTVVNNGNVKKFVNMSQILKSLNTDQWRSIRKMFLIPDFEFPLESASRPSYESILSSFDTNTPLPHFNVTK